MSIDKTIKPAIIMHSVLQVMYLKVWLVSTEYFCVGLFVGDKLLIYKMIYVAVMLISSCMVLFHLFRLSLSRVFHGRREFTCMQKYRLK